MADDQDTSQQEIERRFPSGVDLGRSPEAVVNYADLIRSLVTPSPQSGVPQGNPLPGIVPNQKQLPPQSTGKYGPPPTYPTPPAPQLQSIPQPPQTPEPNPFEAFKNPVVALSIIGSLFTRRPLVAAMGAAGSAMNAQRQNQQDQFNQNKERFHEQLEQAVAQNRVELEKYQVALDRAKTENWNKVLPDMWADATAHDDKFMMQALKMGPEMAQKVMISRDSAMNALDKATAMAQIRADIAAQQKYGAGNTPADAARDIVDGMVRGDEPPTVQGLGGLTGSVRADASRRHFNLAQAQLEWLGAQTQMRSLHGPQMTRYFALAESVKSTIDRVLETSEQLKLGQYPIKNHADLIYLVQTKANTTEGKLAIQYLADIGTLKEEFANLAQGGGVPTEPAWAQANKLINEDFGVTALDTSLKEVRRLIGYRVGAIKEQGSQPYNPAGNASTALPTVKTREEADKLAPGTHYLTPEGKEYVR